MNQSLKKGTWYGSWYYEQGAQIALWGETAYPNPRAFTRQSETDLPDQSAWKVQRGFDIPIVFGTVTRDITGKNKYPYNTGILIDGDGIDPVVRQAVGRGVGRPSAPIELTHPATPGVEPFVPGLVDGDGLDPVVHQAVGGRVLYIGAIGAVPGHDAALRGRPHVVSLNGKPQYVVPVGVDLPHADVLRLGHVSILRGPGDNCPR